MPDWITSFFVKKTKSSRLLVSQFLISVKSLKNTNRQLIQKPTQNLTLIKDQRWSCQSFNFK